MECLLCHLRSLDVSEMKKHYVDFHAVDENDPYFLELFQPDTLNRKCSVVFPTCRKKKNHMFLYHYNQRRGARQRANNDLPLNIFRRGQITYYSVNFDQHKNYFDFHSTDMVDVFLDVVYHAFKPQQNLMYKFQGYFEITNQQRGPEHVLTDKRVWLTNVYRFKYFNEFVRGEIKDEIIKRVIINGQSGSSWFFKRFSRLNIITVPLLNELQLVTN